MTKENFNRIMAGLEEARRHAAGEDVPGMVIHTPFAKGDRVRLRASEAEGWLMPWRKFAREGRCATITGAGVRGTFWLEFDVGRRGARPHRLDFLPRYIEHHQG